MKVWKFHIFHHSRYSCSPAPLCLWLYRGTWRTFAPRGPYYSRFLQLLSCHYNASTHASTLSRQLVSSELSPIVYSTDVGGIFCYSSKNPAKSSHHCFCVIDFLLNYRINNFCYVRVLFNFLQMFTWYPRQQELQKCVR